jgi:hypothetical protein
VFSDSGLPPMKVSQIVSPKRRCPLTGPHGATNQKTSVPTHGGEILRSARCRASVEFESRQRHITILSHSGRLLRPTEPYICCIRITQ